MEEDDSNNATDKWVDARCIVNDRFTQDQLFLFKNSLKNHHLHLHQHAIVSLWKPVFRIIPVVCGFLTIRIVMEDIV